MFKALINTNINLNVLSLIENISRLLANEQQFYKLRYLMERFILPQLVLRAKICNKPGVQQAVLRICQLFVFGFWNYLNIGRNGLNIILFNVQLTQQSVRRRWLCMCKVVSVRQGLVRQLQVGCKQRGVDIQQVRGCELSVVMRQNLVWQLTTRNVKKHKIYKTFDRTQYKGIKNRSCGRDSVIQSVILLVLCRHSS